MKTKLNSLVFGAVAMAMIGVTPVLAATTAPKATKATKAAEQTLKMSERGDAAITARVNSLNSWIDRIGNMKRLSDSDKTTLTSSLKNEINDLNSLSGAIKNDTSTTSMRADVAKIAPNFRIYMLVEPKISILAAVDRIDSVSATLQTLSSKLAARLNASTTVMATTSLSATLADMNAKIADAGVQASAAQALVAPLMPDNNDKTVMASNRKALSDARAKVKAATADLVAARKDAQTIAEGLKGTKAKKSK